jgi:hypothetical protein
VPLLHPAPSRAWACPCLFGPPYLSSVSSAISFANLSLNPATKATAKKNRFSLGPLSGPMTSTGTMPELKMAKTNMAKAVPTMGLNSPVNTKGMGSQTFGFEDLADVGGGRVLGDRELCGDLPVGRPAGDQVRNLLLATCKCGNGSSRCRLLPKTSGDLASLAPQA